MDICIIILGFALIISLIINYVLICGYTEFTNEFRRKKKSAPIQNITPEPKPQEQQEEFQAVLQQATNIFNRRYQGRGR